MTPTIDNVLGSHAARLDGLDEKVEELRKQQTEDRSEVRSLKNMLISTLLAALGGLLMQFLSMLLKK